MKASSVIPAASIEALILPCVRVLPEGFAIDLSRDPLAWRDALRSYGGKALCDTIAEWLSRAYETTFQEPFLFTEPCMSFELRYHLYAYLWTQGLKKLRPLTTLPFSRARLARSCRSVEIDTGDVYRWTQRIVFRYFFGIRPLYRRTDRDPYAARIGSRFLRIPFLRK